MNPQKKATAVIERLTDMITASQDVLDSMPVEVQTAEVMRQDQNTWQAAIDLLRDAYKITKH